MGKGMPYHLEKGPTLALFEEHLNRPNTAPEYEMHALLQDLRKKPEPGDYSWLTEAFAKLLNSPNVGNGPRDEPIPGEAIRKDLVENWFGGDRAKPSLPGSIGYWIGYRGDVAEIIRNSLCWAVELALGIPHRSDKTGRRHPWPIELFWTCPCPWFESWVVVRPSSVTVVFMTPSHQGSNVSETPVATSATTRPHDPGHPIPSYEDDYQRLGAANALPQRPRVPAHTREFATWVVTHKDHKIAKGSPIVTTNTAVLADFAEWGIPQLCPYQGVGGITIVSPSFPAGGVHHDGRP